MDDSRPGPAEGSDAFEPVRPASTSPAAATLPAPPARQVAAGWPDALGGLAVALAALLAIFWETVGQMVETWYVSATFNHGFMIAPICGWLLWERREALEQYAPRANFYGLIPLFGCVVAWTLANAAGINAGKEFALVGMIQSVVFTFLGWRLVRAMLFPLAFLFFAVPFGDFLIPTLQDVTAVMVVEGLRFIGIPVFIDGVFLTIPTGKFEVAEACSGIRFLIATIALGCLFANMSFRSLSRRTIILVLAVIVPLVANGIRAFGIVYIAHVTDHTVAVGVDHIVYGWIFFAVVTALLLGIGMTFRETDGDNTIYMPAAADRVPGRRGGRRAAVAAFVACVAVALSGPAYADYMLHRGVSQIRPSLAAPASVGDWRAVARVTTDWRPTFVGPDAEVMRTYRRDGREVHLYLAYYTHQRQRAELVNSSNNFVQERSWERASSGMNETKVGGEALSVHTTRLIGQGGNHGRARVVWQWYWIGDRYTSDPLVAKIRQAQARLFGTSQAAAAIVVAADYEDNPAEATETLGDFVTHLDGLAGALAKTVRD